MDTQEVQTTKIRVSRKVVVPEERVKNSEVEKTLKSHYRIATFSEFIANPKVVDKQAEEWVWVADDQLVPTEAGKYEIVREKGKNSITTVSLKKITSDERWRALEGCDRICITVDAARRKSRPILFVFSGHNARLYLDTGSGLGVAARRAVVESEKTAKIAPELLDAARKSVDKLDAAAEIGVLTPEVVKPLKDLIRASE